MEVHLLRWEEVARTATDAGLPILVVDNLGVAVTLYGPRYPMRRER